MKKRHLTILSFVFIIWHFFAVSCCMTQGRFVPDFLYKICYNYVNPIFYQKWNMFAPPPYFDMKMYVKPVGEKVWFDPAINYLEEFNKNRFSKGGKVYKIQDRLIRELYVQTNIKESTDYVTDTFFIETHLDSLKIKEPLHNYLENILPAEKKGKFVEVLYKSVYPPKFNSEDTTYTEHVYLFKPIFIDND